MCKFKEIHLEHVYNAIIYAYHLCYIDDMHTHSTHTYNQLILDFV